MSDDEGTDNELYTKLQKDQQCNACNMWGGNWPGVQPWYGGPAPTRTWSRANGIFNFDFHQSDIDMRRKAETLQHRQNQNHSGMTKAQRWAYAVKNKSRSQKWLDSRTAGSNPCFISSDDRPNTYILNVPPHPHVPYNSSTCSDVPNTANGPIDLYYDKKVPLLPLRHNPKMGSSGGQNVPEWKIGCDGAPTPVNPPGPSAETLLL